jgi:electron transfer flavoprotein alpha subunit
MQNVLAILIGSGGGFGRTEIELLSAGRRLAQQLGGDLAAAILGRVPDTWNDECFAYGADKVLRTSGIDNYQNEAYSAAAHQVAKVASADVVLLPSTTYALEVAPVLAYRLGASVILDCIALEGADGTVKITKPVYGGKANSELIARKPPVVVAMRMRSVAPAEQQENRRGEVATIDVDLSSVRARTKIIERQVEESANARLEDARIIVSGGRGIGGKENFARLDELARVLGGTVGASRAACDLGWVPATLQIGQTGKKVAPDLYLAVGISGASQHLVGIAGAKHIVAINTDPKSPIFQVAEVGVVDDWKTFLPKLTEALKQSKAAGGGPAAA